MTVHSSSNYRIENSTKKSTLHLGSYKAKITRSDTVLVILIFFGFILAGTMQFLVILKLPFTPKIFTMPLVMALIFSITIVRLRIMKRRLIYEQEQKDFVQAKVELLNHQLKELLQQRTERLIAAQDQVALAQARADLGALAAGVIHDINNALTAISMGWEGLEYAEDDELEDYRTAISTGLSKARAISSEFKSFLRPPHEDSTEVIGLTRRLLSLLRRSMGPHQRLQLEWGSIHFQESDQVWTPKGPDDIPPQNLRLCAALSEGQITQILMNLVVNAQDALHNEPGIILVTVKADPTQVIFIISDTGIGMSEELQSKIFDPFFTTKERGEGTGLGLHVILNLIKRIHGNLHLESEIGQGTTFTISLPCV